MPRPIIPGVRRGPFGVRIAFTESDAPSLSSVSPNSGNQLGGTAVTLKGKNFILDGTGANIQVAFDGIAATSVVVVDRQTITCVTPSMPDIGLVDIVVSISDTKSAALLGAFTAYVSVITEVSPTHGPIAGGTVVAIAGYNFVAGSTITFGGVAATDVVIIDAQHARCLSPNHADGYVDVAVVEPGGADAVSRSGFQYTLLNRGEDIRRNPGITIQDTLNNSPNTCGFRIDGSAPAPKIGEKIEIHDSFDNDRLLFAGTIQSISQIYEGQTDQLAWDVQGVDFTWLMNRRRPFGTYINVSVSNIVKDLAARYAIGFTTIHVQTNLAKVTIVFDGTQDLSTCYSVLAAMIGGGHWFVDYHMDIHFFHIVTNIPIPPSAMPATDAGHMTVSEGALSGAGQLFTAGYYLFRHTFLYSDGSESTLQSISNVLLCTGQNILSFTGVPLGADPGSGITCIGRRIYSNRFITGYPGGDPIETIQGFVQINDNTTAAFTTWFGTLGVSDPVNIVALGPINTLPTPSVATPAGFALLSNTAAQVLLNGGIDRGTYGISGLISPPADPIQQVINGIPQTAVMFPITSSSDGSFAGPTGFQLGDVITFKFTASDSQGGETIVGVGPGLVWTLTSAGYGGSFVIPIIVAPTFPAGATVLSLYASCPRVDGGNYHRTGSVTTSGARIVNVLSITITSGQPSLGTNVLNQADSLAAAPLAPTTNTAHSQAAGWVGYNGVTQLSEAGPFPTSGGVVAYFATTQLAATLESAAQNLQIKPPIKQFNGHPAPPTGTPAATIDVITGLSAAFMQGGAFQFKVACLYRDGSVSYAGTASATVTAPLIAGNIIRGFNLTAIPLGVAIGTNDVVARFIYVCIGASQNPNFSLTRALTVGQIWPIGFKEPDWVNQVSQEIIIISDNLTTQLLQFGLSEGGAGAWTTGVYTGAEYGRGNLPYNNSSLQAISVDPIPLWPNPDGPSLEDNDPPDDIDDFNDSLLHEDTGSQPFNVFVDLSQARNRILVFGSGSVLTTTANVGDTQINIGDVSAFSPVGGTVAYLDPATGDYVQFKYTGIGGIAGAAFITLTKSLQRAIAQGTNISNFLQADDVESQTFLSKIELDKNGATTDGIHEYVIVDTSLKASFQLYMRAYAELELFGKPITTVKYATRDAKSRSGQTVHVDLSDPPCQGDFLIQSVTIDQIHDESDDLSPRYTVSASSVKFELNDLLLQIFSGTISEGTGSSVAGLTQSAISQALAVVAATPVAAASAVDISQLMRAVSLASIYESSSSGNMQALIGIAPSVGGASSATFIDSRGVWSRITSAATVGGSAANVTATSPTVRLDHNPTWLVHFRLNDITSVRVWAGFWSNNPSDADVSVRAGCGVRFSTVAGDTGFRPVAFDGSVQTLGGTVGPVIANTEYLLRCAVSGNGTLLTVTLVDVVAGTQTSATLAIPSGATGQALLFGLIRVMPQTTSARIVDVLRWATEYGEAIVPIT